MITRGVFKRINSFVNRKRSGKLVDKVEANIQIEYHKYPSYPPGHVIIILFRVAHAGENEINAKSSTAFSNYHVVLGDIRLGQQPTYCKPSANTQKSPERDHSRFHYPFTAPAVRPEIMCL